MANNEKKITKAMNFGAIIDLLSTMPEEKVLAQFTIGKDDKATVVPLTVGIAIDKLKHEMGLLSKKNAGEGKTSKVTAVQEQMEREILLYLSDFPNQLFSASELCKNIPGFAEQNPPVSTQKITPRLNAMLNRGEVKVTKEKGKNMWQYVTPEYEDDYEDEDFEEECED